MKRAPAGPADPVAAMREFNRFYTREIGVLNERLLASPYSLTEARLLYELLHRPGSTASELAAIVGINLGYMSRILGRFASGGLIEKSRSRVDGRQLLLNLTAKGRREYAAVDRQANGEIVRLLQGVPTGEVATLLEAMQTIHRVLSARRSIS